MYESTTTERAVRSLEALGLSPTVARSFTAFALCLRWNDGPESTDPATLPPDDVFDVLRERRRRYALYCLFQHDRPVSVETLARWIAALEEDAPPETIAVDDVDRIETDLYHAQIPRLADAGLVDHDGEDDTVSVAASGSSIQPYLLIAARDDLTRSDAPKP